MHRNLEKHYKPDICQKRSMTSLELLLWGSSIQWEVLSWESNEDQYSQWNYVSPGTKYDSILSIPKKSLPSPGYVTGANSAVCHLNGDTKSISLLYTLSAEVCWTYWSRGGSKPEKHSWDDACTDRIIFDVVSIKSTNLSKPSSCWIPMELN